MQIELVQIQVAYIHGSYLHKKDSFGKVIWDIFILQNLSPFSCEFQVLNISKEMQGSGVFFFGFAFNVILGFFANTNLQQHAMDCIC